MDYEQLAASILLDRQYHRTVLKVPDAFRLSKGVESKQMQLTGHELFQVVLPIFSFSSICNIKCCIH